MKHQPSRRLFLTTLLYGCSLAVMPARVAAPAEPTGTLTFLYNLPALHTWDPTSALIKPNVGIYKLIFDRLIERDAGGDLHPSLATEWNKLGSTKWELKLRGGVKFQDGSRFEAEDVK